MFTGITQGLFRVNTVLKREGLLHYTVILNGNLVKGLKQGASVAIDGVCQTVVSIDGLEVGFDAMLETLSKTTLSELAINKKVSVERSIGLDDEIGGHEVSGHVFEKGEIIAKKNTNNNLCLTIQCSDKCFSFIKTKGFIAVDGSSLTVGVVNKAENSFEVYLIPETLRVTNFGNKNVGDHVNLEPDMKTMILVEAVQSHFADIYHRLEKIENQLKVK
ncbi:riboflavin synthase alpha chain [Candidatus Rickettsiella viridis]|uniref:Riboflavin synthase n=1 Tax=Candidatus Rickettsiella viridis TaxID=676208 RepID=A0A2Z5UXI1_9COXI|nr:riboflavin synthase subunit alpha [Candidatus Rickettsiella viridis]BBB15780.1 riboflavin synthase alpha chain [Candidatus Rickettsiella viridis]